MTPPYLTPPLLGAGNWDPARSLAESGAGKPARRADRPICTADGLAAQSQPGVQIGGYCCSVALDHSYGA
jgi:hypothetical protein